MAKYGNEEGVERFGRRFRDECFIDQKSIIDGRQIWTSENFDELYHCYNERPDESNDSFDDKLKRQLAGASSDAIQLFGELYVLDLLVLGNINPETKASKIHAVLARCTPPLSLPVHITEVFEEGGALNGGYGFNTNRYRQFWLLIELGQALSRMTREERENALAQDSIEATVYSLPDTREVQIQRALCYLFAPKQYPPITAGRHLQQITEHFGPGYLSETENEDLTLSRKVGLILERIRDKRGSKWNFYLDQEAWIQKAAPKPSNPAPSIGPDEDAPDPTDVITDPNYFDLPEFSENDADSLWVSPEWLDRVWTLLHNRKQIIFAGPPGTGKTFLAKSIAKKLSASEDSFRLVQFHASYGYEDFFEGYRPSGDGGTGVSLELKKGPLRKIVDQAAEDTENPYFLVIDEINRGNLARIFGELYFLLEYRDESVQLMYSGDDLMLPPNLFIIGTMNTSDRSIALVDAAIRRRFAFLELHPAVEPTSDLLRHWCEVYETALPLNDIWQELNSRITANGGDRNQLIGPSYFLRSYEDDFDGLTLTWETEILPLVDEMFLDQYDWVREVFDLGGIINTVEH